MRVTNSSIFSWINEVLQKTNYNEELLETNFAQAKLTNINFTDSTLLSANLEGAYLSNIDFTNSNLQDSNLENTTWHNVNFSNCHVNGAVFSDAQGLTDEQKQWLKKNGALNVS